MTAEGLALPWPALASGLVVGMLLAATYLWLLTRSVRSLARARHPARRLLLGSLIRLLMVGAVFGGMLHVGNVPQALAAVVGFVMVRTVVVRWRISREAA